MHEYLPIAEHGIIGDLHTIALIGSDGTIDWYCCPTFDSPSVFASILDKERGGYYRITPARAGWTTKQLYFPDTNVLITRFFSSEGVGELQGFMPIARTGEELHRHRLIRRVVAVRGEMRFRLDLQPRFNYGRDPHRTEQYEHGVVFEAPEISLALQTTSLPEQLGGPRNWDYRYTWIRDAAFSLYALLRLGFTEEAAAFMDWLTDRFREGRNGDAGLALEKMFTYANHLGL